jgi:ligand-binding sensor protein
MIPLTEMIDIQSFQILIDKLYAIAKIPFALLDPNGIVYVKAGWTPLCTEIHRNHPEVSKLCITSDSTIFDRINQGEKNVIYKCPMGLVDCATPILISNQHVGTIFTGQFLYAPPNKEFFLEQAKKYSIDPDKYWDLVHKLPIFSEEQVLKNLDFLSELAVFIAQLGITNIENAQKTIQVQEKELYFTKLFQRTPIPIVISDFDFNWIHLNSAFEDLFGYHLDEFSSILDRDNKVFPSLDDQLFLHEVRKQVKKTPINRENIITSNFPKIMYGQTKTKNKLKLQVECISLDENRYFLIMENLTEKNRLEMQKIRNQKIESLAIIAGGIAHDFNNTLMGIIGNVNLLQMEEELSLETQATLVDLEKAVKMASNISNQLLTF